MNTLNYVATFFLICGIISLIGMFKSGSRILDYPCENPEYKRWDKINDYYSYATIVFGFLTTATALFSGFMTICP